MSLLLVGLQIAFIDLSYVSDLAILSSYFISFVVWTAEIGQVSVNVTLIIALIINFTFKCTFIYCFYNHHDYQILEHHV